MWRWLLAAVLTAAPASAQTATTVAWDLDPTHDLYAARFELEVDGAAMPCAPVVVLSTERRCGPVTVSSGVPHAFRLRGIREDGAAGEYSDPVSTGPGGLPPGAFTITATLAPAPPEPSDMALPDGEAILSGRHAGATVWTLSGKTTAGTDRVGVLRFMAATAAPVGSVTWNGVAMTLVGTVARGSNTIYGYRIVNPPTAAADILITFSSSAPSGPYVVSSYNSVDQSDPIGDVQSAQGTGTTPTVNVSSAADDLVLDAMDVANVIGSVGADQTAEFLDTTGGSDRFGGSREAGAATVTMSWTTNSGAWSILAFSLNAAAAEPDASDAASDGTSTASATGSALADASGTSAGSSTAAAEGSSLAEAEGTAAGASTATATGSSLADADATAAGSSTAAAEGSSTADADATAAGSSTASASSLEVSTATAAGSSSATAEGSALATAAATASGTSSASASGASTADATATASGTSTATAVGSTAEDVIPDAIAITDEAWAVPSVAAAAWAASRVTGEAWRRPTITGETWT